MNDVGTTWKRFTAEGAVIVLGVLIALAADRYAQAIDDRGLERQYLTQLLAEFDQSNTDLSDAARFAQTRLEYAEVVLSAIEGTLSDTVDAHELVLSLGLSYWLFDPPLSRNTWGDLVSTGRSELLTNQSLRREIAGFYLAMDLQSEFHREWTEFVLPYRREVSTIISPQLQLAIAQSSIANESVPDELVPSRSDLLGRIRASPDLRNLIGEALTTNWAGAAQYERASQWAQHIAELLRTELGWD